MNCRAAAEKRRLQRCDEGKSGKERQGTRWLMGCGREGLNKEVGGAPRAIPTNHRARLRLGLALGSEGLGRRWEALGGVVIVFRQ